MEALARIAARLRERDGFTIIAHVSPDGDTLGSSLALFHGLKAMGKRAQIICEDPVPHRYLFLPGRELVKAPGAAEPFPNAIAVDCADKGRMGAAAPFFERAEYRAVVDHHVTNPGYGMDNAVDGHAAAAGEIMYSLLSLLLPKLSPEMACCLYVAIVTDTGNFAYSNTRPQTFQTCGRLVEAGADNVEIDRYLNRNKPFCQTRLLGIVLSRMALHLEGKLCAAYISREDLALCGMNAADSEGVVEHVRDIEGVELAILVRETPTPGQCKISLRSKDLVDVSAMAARMHGGGHVHAAGYSDHGSLQTVLERALLLGEEALKACL